MRRHSRNPSINRVVRLSMAPPFGLRSRFSQFPRLFFCSKTPFVRLFPQLALPPSFFPISTSFHLLPLSTFLLLLHHHPF